MRDGLIKAIDPEDRVWYIVLPIAGYLLVAASDVALALALALALQSDAGCAALAVSMGLLLAVDRHNAWDITVWSITRRRE